MLCRILCSLVVMACAVCAHADTFTLKFDDGAANVLTLTGAPSSAGIFNITGATGMVDGLAATLAPINSLGGNDNLLLFPAQNGTYLDFNGLTFNLSNGLQYNLYYNSNPLILGYRYSLTGGAAYGVNSLSVTSGTSAVSATPEPTSLALLGTGMLGMVGVMRRKLVA